MAAVDTLDDLTTKVAEKLNALYAQIGDRAMIGVSSDSGNLLSTGSDQRPYFDGSNIAIGVSANAGNDLTLGTDNKPYLANDKYVPLTRQLSVGIGLNPIGDLSEDRTVSLDLDYLDSRYSAGYKQRGAVRVATASNITLSGLQTIDGVAVVAGNRVLVRAQTDASENGIWVVAAGAWTRASDFDEPVLGEVEQGAAVFVEEGALLDKTGWTLKTPPPYVMGTTPLEFDQYAGASSYVGGNLITIAGNQINHDSGSWSNKSNLSGATVISNLSVDAYGHLTNWTTRNLTAANIGAEPSFSKNSAFNKNFGTSADTVAQGNHTHTFSSITGKPTSLSGYGITDAYTKSEGDNRYFGKAIAVPTNDANDFVNDGYVNARPWATNAPPIAHGTTLGFGENASGFRQIHIDDSGDMAVRALRYDASAWSDWHTFWHDGNFNPNSYVPTSRTVSSGTGLTGGGNLGSNRTLSFDTTWGDSRYVNVTGDTMTGYLTVNGDINAKQGIKIDSEIAITSTQADDSRILISGGDSPTVSKGAYITVEGNNYGGTNQGGNIRFSMSSGKNLISTRAIISNEGISSGTGTLINNADDIHNLPSVQNGVLFNMQNSSGSTGFATGFGASFGIRGSNPERTFFLYKPNGGSQDFYISDYGNGSSWRHSLLYHSSNHRSDVQNDARYALQTTTINAGTGLTGGGNLSANRTLAFDTTWGDNRYVAIGGSGASLTNLNGSNISSGTVSSARIGNLPASKITSGTFASARISQSSVTQHNSAINAGMVDGYHIWSGTQAAYDAIATKDSNTLYFIT